MEHKIPEGASRNSKGRLEASQRNPGLRELEEVARSEMEGVVDVHRRALHVWAQGARHGGGALRVLLHLFGQDCARRLHDTGLDWKTARSLRKRLPFG